MRSHQRYFSLRDAQGKLLPRFIAVSNTPVKSEKLSLEGYERVLRARLTDGRFFFDEDRRTKLADRTAKLARVTWQAKLNSSYADKVQRFRALAVWLAQRTNNTAYAATIERAAELSKADLVTGMVGEFPELQGVMGREYALHDGEPKAVALAIFEHYLPRGANDALPTEHPGALIGLADRLDTLCGLFAIGEKPTGAKDQFGLRRAAIAFLNLVLARGYRFSLSEAVRQSLAQYGERLKPEQRAVAEPQVLEFFRDRLRPLWNDAHRADVIEAVLAAGFDDLVAAKLRLDALSQCVQRDDFAALAATFKRVANIVEKQAKDVARGPVDSKRLEHASERELHAQVAKVKDSVAQATRADRYAEALAHVVPLRPYVDAFFDGVMVMADDKSLRENRVRLLMEIGALFGAIADFAKIQAEG
jgi:glycyl-tRNA synthetase beta chain